MGSFIELNDTLRITKEQGFPETLDLDKHLSAKSGYFKTEMFKDKIFEFTNKPGIRVYKVPPVRNFLVEYTDDGKWLYWGLCHIVEIKHDYINQTTSGKYKIIHINSPEEMKKAFDIVDRVWKNNYFTE